MKKHSTSRKNVEPVTDAIVDKGMKLLKNPRVPKKIKRQLVEAAFHGVQTGEVSFSQLCKISRA